MKEMSLKIKITAILLSFLIFISGCVSVRVVANPETLVAERIKGGYRLQGVFFRKVKGEIWVFLGKRVPVDKSFVFSGKILIKNGLTPTANVCLAVWTDNGTSFSFGPRGSGFYCAARDTPPVFIDHQQQKPFFKDEAFKPHLIKVKYTAPKKIIEAYVDDILFGILNVSKAVAVNKYFCNFNFCYNTLTLTKPEIEFTGIKIKVL
jgi:hypothetical protein